MSARHIVNVVEAIVLRVTDRVWRRVAADIINRFYVSIPHKSMNSDSNFPNERQSGPVRTGSRQPDAPQRAAPTTGPTEQRQGRIGVSRLVRFAFGFMALLGGQFVSYGAVALEPVREVLGGKLPVAELLDQSQLVDQVDLDLLDFRGFRVSFGGVCGIPFLEGVDLNSPFRHSGLQSQNPKVSESIGGSLLPAVVKRDEGSDQGVDDRADSTRDKTILEKLTHNWDSALLGVGATLLGLVTGILIGRNQGSPHYRWRIKERDQPRNPNR